MTQAPTPGPLSVGDRVVAVADLRKHPDGPVWVKKGEEVGIVREYGVGNCIAGVALQDGREGDWAKSCFRLAPTALVEASGSERDLTAGIALLTEKADQNDAAASNVEDWHSAMPGDVRAEMKAEAAAIRTILAALRPPSGETREGEHDDSVAGMWGELLEKDDRTSPADQPDMLLITFDELVDFVGRTAPTAPVEASGSEREHGPKCWGKTSISDEMMYCYCGSTDSPPGETREALDRLKMAAHVYEDDEMAADCATLEALLSARPLALGGQKGIAKPCACCWTIW